jgi:chitinase
VYCSSTLIYIMHYFKTLLTTGFLATLASARPTYPSYYPLRNRFTAEAGNRLTVYWGAEDDSTTLEDVCNDDSYDIVALAFVNYFFSDGGYPSLSLSSLDGPSAAQSSVGATSLQDGSSLVPAIKACQAAGKLVVMSLGGANAFADVTLESDEQGEQIADTLWDLFGGGNNGTTNRAIRPFGDVKLDGFDLGV